MNIEKRHLACAECVHATFIRGFDADGLYVPLVACAGGGYKEISFEHKGGTIDCLNKSER